MVHDWETGRSNPGYLYVWLLCTHYDKSDADLNLADCWHWPVDPRHARLSLVDDQQAEHQEKENKNTDRREFGLATVGAAVETLALVHGILGPKVDPAAIVSIESATYNLGRLYPREPPVRVLPQVHQQFRLAQAALKNGPTLLDHPRLLAVAGWHCLLLAMLHYDLAHYQAAHVARDTAYSLGQQVGDGDIVGWAFETAAWFAIYDGSPHHVVDAAEEGVRQSPVNSPARVMNILKMGIGWARLGRALEAQRAIEQADAIIPHLPSVPHPDHHFSFDRFKFNLYTARIYAFLNLPTQAEHQARLVIDSAIHARESAGEYSMPPTRESFGRLDLASALVDRGELDAASHEASQAFGLILRYDVLLRAGEIDAQLTRRDPKNSHVRDFHEKYLHFRRVLNEP